MKTAVITGASGGIGRAAAISLAEAGMNLALHYNKNEAEALSLRDELISSGTNAEIFKADITRRDEVDAMFSAIEKRFGGAGILVNNAGISQQKMFCDITEEEWDGMFAVHMKGAYFCAQAALPFMVHEKWGRIINISSMWGSVGASCEVHYSAAKAAQLGFTKALAKELAPSGITVNAITPGVIDTKMNRCFPEEILKELADETPAGRLGTPMEVAAAIKFLASEEAAFITGQVLGISGGFVVT